MYNKEGRPLEVEMKLEDLQDIDDSTKRPDILNSEIMKAIKHNAKKLSHLGVTTYHQNF